MKKILLSMLLLVPILTGCANVDTKITINDDRSASIATSVSYEGDLGNPHDMAAVLIHDNYSKYLGKGFKVDRGYNSKLSTIIATKKVRDLDTADIDLAPMGFVSNLKSGKFIDLKKSFLVKSFNVDCTFDYTKEADKYADIIKATEVSKTSVADEKGLNPEYYQRYAKEGEFEVEKDVFAQNMDETVKPVAPVSEAKDTPKANIDTPIEASVSIQVPSLAFYNNADSVSGNLYTWNIKKDAPTRVKLQYVQYSGWAIATVILVGILLLILAAKKIIKHENQKRVGNSENLAK